ncbi:ty3-gypsy retrotransposon protein [Cucumis melo var. makuwa]|uniref:Ty3-gypsy retrotransposon protein n=1 Tax=Cucumis melo var. makuwa TaxID=1194695 RepID=A0A5A7UJA9_CUCMM|nr:ty3-gypsy retrotransposon protein [Cucumis melo var. makuwa]
MASKKAAFTSSIASDAYTGHVTRIGIVIKENPLYDNLDSSKSKKEAHPDVMSIMMADVTVEATMAEMERRINLLMKVFKKRNHKIAALREQMRTRETAESSQTPIVKGKGRMWCRKTNNNNNQLLLLLSQISSYRI